jgi:hypothetical protein
MPLVYLSRKRNVDQAGPTKINTTEIVRWKSTPRASSAGVEILINLNSAVLIKSGWRVANLMP